MALCREMTAMHARTDSKYVPAWEGSSRGGSVREVWEVWEVWTVFDMHLRGIHYDVGIDTVDQRLTREQLTEDRAARDVDTIARELHANAVRLTGRDVERLAMAGELAAGGGLEVWLSPLLVNGTPGDTLALLGETAGVAERLRRQGHAVVLVVGCELSLFLSGVLPGENVLERAALLADPARLLPAVMAAGVDPRERVAAFLAQAVDAARSRFGGPLTYASGTWEDVDWEPFDFVGVDAYRDAGNRDRFAQDLAAYGRHGRPVVVTEFGCATFRGAQDLGGLAWTVVDRSAGPARIPAGTVRDEALQAAELTQMLEVFEAAGAHGAFVFTFAMPSYPGNDLDPQLDLDTASYALVRTWPDGRTQPKASFRAVADYYGRLRGSAAASGTP